MAQPEPEVMSSASSDSKEIEAPPPGALTTSSDKAALSSPTEQNPQGAKKPWHARLLAVYDANSFVINVIIAIGLAYAAPGVGLALAPSITASRVAVGVIFLLTGLGLRTRELASALANVKFNAVVQAFNLGVMPLAAWAIAQGLRAANALDADLARGVFICGALPMTVNMVIVLTKSSNGDEAAAVFNSAFGNCLGIFVTPAWVLLLLGETASFSVADFVARIAQRVLGPLAVGQFVQYRLPRVAAWAKKHKKPLKKLQEALLVFIVYTAFCSVARERRRKDGTARQGPAKIIVMILVQGAFLLTAMAAAWTLLGVLFPRDPELRVMGLFGCTHKTVAMGIPLIDAIFSDESKSRVGIFLLPLLIYHPGELIVGSAIATRLAAWVDERRAHLGPRDASQPADADDVELSSSEQQGSEPSRLGADDDLALGPQNGEPPPPPPPPPV